MTKDEALKIGDRVVIKDTAGFSKRLHGIITDFKQDKFWVLRDGACKPVWFHPDELQLEEALIDFMLIIMICLMKMKNY